MNNKVKRVLVLLFVVSTLLIMIGSVSANTDDLNETLETSNALNSDLSAVSEDIDSGADKYVSNQLTISDEKTNVSQTTLGSTDSNVVSNYEDTTIDSKDSDNNVIKASIDGNDILSAQSFYIVNTALDPYAKVGDEVTFKIYVLNTGDTYQGMTVDGQTYFVGIDFRYDPTQLEYTGKFTPSAYAVNYLDPIRNYGQVLFAYNTWGDFRQWYSFEYTATFRVLSTGTLRTSASVMGFENSAKSEAQTDVAGFTITNTALNPYANVGDEINFEINVVNTGGTYQGMTVDGQTYFVGIDFRYDPTQLEYTGKFTPSAYAVNYLDPIRNYGQVLFAYNTWGDFKNGYSFKFTATFKVLSAGTLKTSAAVMNYENSASDEALTNVADFTITNTALTPYANVGDIVKFEVYGVNNGGAYKGMQDGNTYFVGMNFEYDSNELEYIGITPAEWEINYLEPRNYPNQNLVQFAYNTWGGFDWGGFHNGDYFNFTVNFRVKSAGTLKTTASVIGFDNAVSEAQTDVAKFEMTVTPSTTITNIGDVVGFNIYVKNVGGTFFPDLYEGYRFVGINFNYDPSILEYAGYAPEKNEYNQNLYSENYLEPKINAADNLAQFAYKINDEGFCNQYSFNFTVFFKVIDHGASNCAIAITQYYNTVFSNYAMTSIDPTFTISNTPGTKTMSVGDTVTFTYVIQNKGSKYGEEVNIEVDFDADKMQFLSLNPNNNLEIKSIYYTSAHNSDNGVLGASDGDVLGADSSVGHIVLGYTSDGFGAGDSVSFDVNFKAITSGKLQTSAGLQGDASKYSTTVYGTAYSGEKSFKLTKTPDAEFKNVGDFVYYTIRLENNGTLHFTDKDYIEFNDYYLEGLKYVGYDIEGLEDHISSNDIEHSIDEVNGGGHVYVKYNINDNDGFAPGSVIEFKLIFEIISPGIRCNHIFSEWGTYTVASVAVEEPDFNLTKKCLNESVDINDLVYYEIFLENTGNISYFDHENAYGDQFLMIEDLYPEGLEFVDYIINPDKNGNRWEGNYESITDDPANHCVLIKYNTWQGWEPGDTLNITLIFKAVKYGKLVNSAHVYWHWKDFGPKESQKDVVLDDEAETVVGPADFAIQKISNFKVAKVGEVVSFSIVYTNTGNKTIKGAYIIDSQYSQGLKYLYYSNENDWRKDGDKWYYNGDIEAGQSVTLKLFFEALTAGQMSNTAKAGHSSSDEDKEDTDTVLIKEGVNGTATTEGQGMGPQAPDDDPDEKLEKEPDEPNNPSAAHKVNEYAAKNTIHETGNPFVVLLLSLLTLCFVGRKGKK